LTVQVDYRKFCHEQNFIRHVSKISLVKVLQGACQPRTSKDGQSQYNIARQAKHQYIVHVERTCRVHSTWGGRWELAFLVEETAGVFTKFFIGSAFSKF